VTLQKNGNSLVKDEDIDTKKQVSIRATKMILSSVATPIATEIISPLVVVLTATDILPPMVAQTATKLILPPAVYIAS